MPSYFLRFIVFFGMVCCFCKGGIAQEHALVKTSQDANRTKLLTLFAGEWISRGLYVATKLEIADSLCSAPKSAKELAGELSVNQDSLYRVLHMLAGFGVFEEVSHGVFSNTETSLLLTKSHPESLHALCLFYGEDIHKSWDAFFSSIQTGTPAFELAFNQPVFSYFKDNPSQAALFQKAMQKKSAAVIKSALSVYNFSNSQTVYDIGGGQGHFMQALLQQYPHLSGLLFELPEVIGKIQKQSTFINHPRCQFFSGDFFDSIPEGGDIYLLKSVIHDWNDRDAEKILKNCHQAMSSQNRLLLVEVVLQPKDLSPYANCMDVLMLAITGGKERSLESFERMLGNCGFTLERIYPTSTEFSILEARKK